METDDDKIAFHVCSGKFVIAQANEAGQTAQVFDEISTGKICLRFISNFGGIDELRFSNPYQVSVILKALNEYYAKKTESGI